MRRADWRRRADDPTTPFGWWWRNVTQGDVALIVAGYGLPLSLAATFFGLSFAWVLGALACAPYAGRILLRDASPDRLAELLPDPPPPGQFRAWVAYRRDGIRIGTDEMALTVVDGWLYAEGVRSHFALRREDVDDLRTGSDRRGRLALSDGSEVLLTGIGDEARIVLERWWQSKALGGGEPTFPPARPHPEEAARWLGRGLASFAVFGALVLLTNAVGDRVLKGFLLLFDFSFILLVLLPLRRRQRPFVALMGEEGPDALWRWRTGTKATEEGASQPDDLR